MGLQAQAYDDGDRAMYLGRSLTAFLQSLQRNCFAYKERFNSCVILYRTWRPLTSKVRRLRCTGKPQAQPLNLSPRHHHLNTDTRIASFPRIPSENTLTAAQAREVARAATGVAPRRTEPRIRA
jgi:hypothetical protein